MQGAAAGGEAREKRRALAHSSSRRAVRRAGDCRRWGKGGKQGGARRARRQRRVRKRAAKQHFYRATDGLPSMGKAGGDVRSFAAEATSRQPTAEHERPHWQPNERRRRSRRPPLLRGRQTAAPNAITAAEPSIASVCGLHERQPATAIDKPTMFRTRTARH